MTEQNIDMLALVQKGPVVEVTPEGILFTVLVPWSQVVQVVAEDDSEGS